MRCHPQYRERYVANLQRELPRIRVHLRNTLQQLSFRTGFSR
jgi:hypothetical protein